MIQRYEIIKFGENWKRLGILICTHGDETLGYNAMKIIEKKINNVTFVLVNKKAYKLGKRYVEFDLNRCFLGNPHGKGLDSYEYMLSKELDKLFREFDNIIDIHSTNFEIDPYFIIDDYSKVNLKIIGAIDNKYIKNIYKIPFSQGLLIGNYKNAVAIECGSNDNPFRVNQIGDIITLISQNLYKLNNYDKNIYKFLGELKKGIIEKLAEHIKDFDLIEKGSLIGYGFNNKEVYAEEEMRIFWKNNQFGNNILAIKLISLQPPHFSTSLHFL